MYKCGGKKQSPRIARGGGGPGRIRTFDLAIIDRLLYR